MFNERAYLQPGRASPVASAFDLSARSAAGDKETYDGAATLTIGGRLPSGARPAHRPPRPDRRPLSLAGNGLRFARTLPDEALKQSRAATLTVAT